MTAARIATGLGLVSLALVLGALGFQYIGGFPPCEMCMWQRYPHFAAILIGLGGGLLVAANASAAPLGKPIAALALLCIAITGAIGVYHAGVEWHWWKGPAACTGPAFIATGKLDLNAHIVSCENAPWRLFGISMAGYNAIISLGAALMAALALRKRA